MWSFRFAGHYVCLCAASCKKLCIDLHDTLPKTGPAQFQGDFILEAVRIDIHCELEVTVAQQGHYGIKSTVTQKR